MTQIFISYSRRDMALVERLSKDLHAVGYEVWYDLSGLEAGKNWGKEIQAAIHNSQVMLVVLSPNSIESEWVEREYLFANNLKLKIIPFLYKTCELPLWSLNIHYIDMANSNYRKSFSELIKVLERTVKPEVSILVPAPAPMEKKPETTPVKPEVEIIEPAPASLQPLPVESQMEAQPEPLPAKPVSGVSEVIPQVAQREQGRRIERELPRKLKMEGEAPHLGEIRKQRWWPFAVGGFVLLLLVGFFAGKQLGFLPALNPSYKLTEDLPVSTIPPTKSNPTPLPTITTKPTPTENFEVSPPDQNFTEPIRKWISTGVSPNLWETFSVQQPYWGTFGNFNGQSLDLASLVDEGVLNLTTNEKGDYYFRIGEAYNTEMEHKAFQNAFVFQYDFKINNANEKLLIQNSIVGYDIHLTAGLDNQNGLVVTMVNDKTGIQISDLDTNQKVFISPLQWHTLQMISFNKNLAIYLDDHLIYYGENVDDRQGGVGLELYFSAQTMNMALDNIKLWDLSTTLRVAESVRSYLSATDPYYIEDFSTPKAYWEYMVDTIIGNQRAKAGNQVQDGVLSLKTEDPNKRYQIEAPLLDIPWKNFSFQYDFKLNPDDRRTGINHAFRFSNGERIHVGIGDQYLNVEKTEDYTDNLIQQYAANGNIEIQRGQWYTVQFIFYNQFLAIYLNDQLIFFQQQIDLPNASSVFLSINTKEKMDIDLDNFKKWNLDYATGIGQQK